MENSSIDKQSKPIFIDRSSDVFQRVLDYISDVDCSIDLKQNRIIDPILGNELTYYGYTNHADLVFIQHYAYPDPTVKSFVKTDALNFVYQNMVNFDLCPQQNNGKNIINLFRSASGNDKPLIIIFMIKKNILTHWNEIFSYLKIQSRGILYVEHTNFEITNFDITNFDIPIETDLTKYFPGISCQMMAYNTDSFIEIKIKPDENDYYFEIEYQSECITQIEQLLCVPKNAFNVTKKMEQNINNSQNVIISFDKTFNSKNIQLIKSIIFDVDQNSIHYAELCYDQNVVARFSQKELLTNHYANIIELENYLISVNGLSLKIFFYQKISGKIILEVKYSEIYNTF